MKKKTDNTTKYYSTVIVVIVAIFFSLSLLLLFQNLLNKNIFLEKEANASSVLVFPKDHGEHKDYKAEWWYINTVLNVAEQESGEENEMGMLLSFSRILRRAGLLSSIYESNSNLFKEKTREGSMEVVLKDNEFLYISFVGTDGKQVIFEELEPSPLRQRRYKLTGSTQEVGDFNLLLKERKVVPNGYNKPLLWGGNGQDCRGVISVFEKDDTYYYSIPDLDITGNIIDNEGKVLEVQAGKAWIDHQWFNSQPPSDWKGHYWASMHLTKESNFYSDNSQQAIGYVSQLYSDGFKYNYWVKRNEDGINECGESADIQLSYKDLIKKYPSDWTISLKKVNHPYIEIMGKSYSTKQVFNPPFPAPDFYEPFSRFKAEIDESNYVGRGYFETHIMNKAKSDNIEEKKVPSPGLIRDF